MGDEMFFFKLRILKLSDFWEMYICNFCIEWKYDGVRMNEFALQNLYLCYTWNENGRCFFLNFCKILERTYFWKISIFNFSTQ